MPNNTLVEYKGGGQDGCWWQWNYFMFDGAGNFYNILSTGYKGVKNEVDAITMVETGKHHVRPQREDHAPTIINLLDEEALIEFVDDSNAQLMIMLAEYLHHGVFETPYEDGGTVYINYDLYGHCTHCGKKCDVYSDMVADDPASEGGVMASKQNLYCLDCIDLREEEGWDEN